MKKTKLFIALIGILFLFNSAVTGGSFIDEDPKKEKQTESVYTEVVYIDDLLGWEIATRTYDAVKKKISKKYQNIEVIFIFGEEFNEDELETEEWMTEALLVEKPIEMEDWMLTPFTK